VPNFICKIRRNLYLIITFDPEKRGGRGKDLDNNKGRSKKREKERCTSSKFLLFSLERGRGEKNRR